jgi:hypothetical protein
VTANDRWGNRDADLAPAALLSKPFELEELVEAV